MNELDIVVIFVLALMLLALLYEGLKKIGEDDERPKKPYVGGGI